MSVMAAGSGYMRSQRPVWPSRLHIDGRRLAGDVQEWLAGHKSWSAYRLSRAAGLGDWYVGKVLSGAAVEVRAENARLVRRAMREIDAQEKSAKREAKG